MIRKKSSDLGSIRSVAIHAHREGLDPAQNEKAVHRSRDRSDRVLQESQAGVQLRMRGKDGSTDHVRMTAEVLGRRMHNQVCSQLEWALEIRS
jgi:hypothetical protein